LKTSRRWRRWGALGAVAAAVVAAGIVAGSAIEGTTATRAATKYTDFAGGGANSISVETFRPSVIFVNAGDSVEFTNPYEEIHTVTFLAAGQKEPDLIVPKGPATAGPPTLIFNPQVAFPAPAQGSASFDGTSYVNSGILNKGQSFVVSFPKEGTYKFICVIHEGMEGTVQVLRSGVTVPTQAARDFEAKTQLDAALAKGEQAAAAVQTGKSTNAAGKTTWTVATGPSVSQVDVMRFIPTRLQINVGDTVTWNNTTLVPHTVTFTSGAAAPELVLPQPSGSGPPDLVLNPQVLFPANAGPNYDGTGYVNSGFIGAGPEATAGTSFSLTFTKAGTYTYICVLHADQGMAGTIVVGTGVTPPSTGDAGIARSPAGGRLLGLAGFGLAALLALGFLIRTRSASAARA
jgi:plastocyanin